MTTSPAPMSDVVCELSEAALLRRLGDSPADAVAVENSRVTKRWIDLRARLYSENQSLQIEQVERWGGQTKRELWNREPAGQLRAVLTLDARLTDLESGAWAARHDAAAALKREEMSAVVAASAPAALLDRMKRAGTPLALDESGEYLTLLPGGQVDASTLSEIRHWKAPLVALLQVQAAAEALARRPVVIA